MSALGGSQRDHDPEKTPLRMRFASSSPSSWVPNSVRASKVPDSDKLNIFTRTRCVSFGAEKMNHSRKIALPNQQKNFCSSTPRGCRTQGKSSHQTSILNMALPRRGEQLAFFRGWRYLFLESAPEDVHISVAVGDGASHDGGGGSTGPGDTLSQIAESFQRSGAIPPKSK